MVCMLVRSCLERAWKGVSGGSTLTSDLALHVRRRLTTSTSYAGYKQYKKCLQVAVDFQFIKDNMTIPPQAWARDAIPGCCHTGLLSRIT